MSRRSWKHSPGGALVEVAGRLVGHENGGVVDQRARDGHPLLLAAGELAGIGPALGREAHLGEDARHPRGNRIVARAGDLEGERDVFRGGPVLEQAEVLEDDAEPAPELGNLVHTGGC